jgi:hypothetical protein
MIAELIKKLKKELDFFYELPKASIIFSYLMNHQAQAAPKRIPFNLFENEIIKCYVQIYGTNSWKNFAKHLLDGTARQ